MKELNKNVRLVPTVTLPTSGALKQLSAVDQTNETGLRVFRKGTDNYLGETKVSIEKRFMSFVDNKMEQMDIINTIVSNERVQVDEGRNRLRLFDGTLNHMSLNEFSARLENLCVIRKWITVEEKSANLLDSTTGKAFELLSRVPTVKDEDRYIALKREVNEAYGLTTEKAIAHLHSRVLRKGETVHDFASDLRRYTEAALPEVPENYRSMVAASHFWPGLLQTQSTKQLFGQWKTIDRSLELAVAMTRDSAESLENNRVSVTYEKGNITKDFTYRDKKCYSCQGYGHIGADCPTPTKRFGKGKGKVKSLLTQ